MNLLLEIAMFALFALIEGTNIWAFIVIDKCLRIISNNNNKARGIWLLTAAYVLVAVSTVIVPVLFMSYIDSKDKNVLAMLAASCFFIVFSSSLVNMSVIYFNRDGNDICTRKDNGCDDYLDLNLVDEWALMVGFTCGGLYAIIYGCCS